MSKYQKSILRGSNPPKKAPFPVRQDNSPTRDYVRAVDHTFFDAHPDTDVFLREFIVGEFDQARLPSSAPAPGYRFAVRVQAFRDPFTGAVIMRIRSFFVLSYDTPLQWYAEATVVRPGEGR